MAGKVITVGMVRCGPDPGGAGHRRAGASARAPGRPGRSAAAAGPAPGAQRDVRVGGGAGGGRRPGGGGAGAVVGDGAGRPGRTDPGGRADDPQRLLQRQPALLRGRRSPRRGDCAAGGGWCSWRARCANSGPMPSGCTAEVAEQIVALDPELLAAVGEFVPAFAPMGDGTGRPAHHAPTMHRRWDRCSHRACAATKWSC